MIAHHRVVEGKKDLLIVILKEKINVDRLPANLRVYIRKFLNSNTSTVMFNLYEI